MPDISPNCQVCGANPGEPCGKGGLHLAARCPINISALDGMEDDRNEISIGELGNMMRRSKDSFESAWGIVKRNDGRNCKECRKRLEDDEFDAPFSWSYTCDDCGHRYKHGEDDPYE